MVLGQLESMIMCCLYVADSLSFVHVDVGLMNVAGIFLSDLDVYNNNNNNNNNKFIDTEYKW